MKHLLGILGPERVPLLASVTYVVVRKTTDAAKISRSAEALMLNMEDEYWGRSVDEVALGLEIVGSEGQVLWARKLSVRAPESDVD